jgi:hypothetical protein
VTSAFYDGSDSILLLLILAGCGWLAIRRIRYLLDRYRSSRWPIVAATVQVGAPGSVYLGKYRGSVSANFVGYAYNVAGARYAAFFVLCGDETEVQAVADRLVGSTVQVRYDPAHPDTSFLLDYEDFRFQGLKASQNPDWLEQSPALDLQDAIRGAAPK